jgi:hypothetical protein
VNVVAAAGSAAAAIVRVVAFLSRVVLVFLVGVAVGAWLLLLLLLL